MFSKKKNDKPNNQKHSQPNNEQGTPRNTRGNNLSILEEGTKIEGRLLSEYPLRIDGLVDGSIESETKLFIAEHAIVNGDITCVDADIFGKVIGKIISTGKLAIKHSGNVKGEIEYNTLEVEGGAQLACTVTQTTGKLEKVSPAQSNQGENKAEGNLYTA